MTTEHTETENKANSAEQESNIEQKQEQQMQEPLVVTAQTESFLVEEIRKNRELTKKTWKWGSVSVLILIFYFTALISSVRSVIFDPIGISAILINEFDQRLPEKLVEFENAMISRAPKNAENILLSILGLLPNVTEQGKSAIDEVHSSLPLLGQEVTSTIKAYVEENKEELRDFARTHSEQEFANHFMEELSANVAMDLDIKIKQAGEKKGLNAIKATSLQRLLNVNSYLEHLASTRRFDLSEKEQLERRTIATWLKFLDWDQVL